MTRPARIVGRRSAHSESADIGVVAAAKGNVDVSAHCVIGQFDFVSG
ncbi:hypothetical protein ACFVJ3_46210 [Rhodococcus sp. NPDC127593]